MFGPIVKLYVPPALCGAKFTRYTVGEIAVIELIPIPPLGPVSETSPAVNVPALIASENVTSIEDNGVSNDAGAAVITFTGVLSIVNVAEYPAPKPPPCAAPCTLSRPQLSSFKIGPSCVLVNSSTRSPSAGE